MARAKKERKPLPPIWWVPDELWAIAEPIIAGLDDAGPSVVGSLPGRSGADSLEGERLSCGGAYSRVQCWR